MSLKTFTKIALFALVFGFSASGAMLLADSCSAQARGCSAYCSISSPPGGSTLCHGSLVSAVCTAYDANGNVTGYVSDGCTPSCI